MIKFNFKKARWMIDAKGIWLTLQVPEALKQQVQDFIIGINNDGEKLYTADIKNHRQKRSLDANAYMWTLVNEIANAMRMDKEECYLMMLKRYGQSTVVSSVSEADVSGFFKYYAEFGKGETNGKEFTHYKIYKGSSEFDSKEMAILIDGIVSEAKEIGIETMTHTELDKMKENWM